MLEEIDGLVDDAMVLAREHSLREILCKIKGIVMTLLDSASKWDRIQHLYEAGVKPVDIARKYDITANAISSRAYRKEWKNPNKLARIASYKKNKNIMHIVCQACEQYFETSSGHAKICPSCKALENMGRMKA